MCLLTATACNNVPEKSSEVNISYNNSKGESSEMLDSSDTNNTSKFVSVQSEKNNSGTVETIQIPSSVPHAELDETLSKFTKRIENLDPSKIEKIVLSTVDPGTGRPLPDTVTENPELIRKWVMLLKKMKVSASKFNPLSGSGFVLSVYVDGKRQFVGSFQTYHIYNSIDDNGTRTQLIIENYDELEEEFIALQNATEDAAKKNPSAE